MSVLGGALDEIRANRRPRWFALVAAAIAGLAAVQLHWYGFVLGGALVGLVSKTPKRGLLAGFAFGIFAWIVFAVLLASHGALWKATATGQILAVSAAIPVVGAGLGSLVRGVV